MTKAMSYFSSLKKIERRGLMVNTPASYSGDPGFESWHGDRLS
jgi:hypothetical protein